MSSYTIHIEPAVNCVFIKFSGTHENGIREKALTEAINNPDYKMGMNIWQDVRDQPLPSNTTYKIIKEKAEKTKGNYDAQLGKCRWATIVGDAKDYGRVHQFVVTGRLRISQVERKPFRDNVAAMEWLGLPEGYEIGYSEAEETT